MTKQWLCDILQFDRACTHLKVDHLLSRLILDLCDLAVLNLSFLISNEQQLNMNIPEQLCKGCECPNDPKQASCRSSGQSHRIFLSFHQELSIDKLVLLPLYIEIEWLAEWIGHTLRDSEHNPMDSMKECSSKY